MQLRVNKQIILGLLLAMAVSNPVSAWATASEEPGLGLDKVEALTAHPDGDAMQMMAAVEPETSAGPVQISEVPAGAYMAGQMSDSARRQMTSVAGYISNYNKRLSWDEASAIAGAIVQFSSRYGVDYRLLTSLIAVESAFRRDAISSAGAIGMGQLKPDTANWLGVLDPYDPVDNIAGTARFLAWLTRKYNGNLEYALSAYYQGPGFVDKNGIAPVCMPYLEKINRALGGLL